jgi:ribonuclease D
MAASPLPPPVLVADEKSLTALVGHLEACPIVAVDTESNSMHAYRERVCVIQFSTPAADYVVDPIAVPDLGALAPLLASTEHQKIFHAAEGDLVGLRRDHHFEFANIFDTMSAARSLGWQHVGMAAVVEKFFGVKLNKKYQRADWRLRPLTPEQLDYARLDTHYLPALRDLQFQELTEAGLWPEAHEEFARLARPRAESARPSPDPEAFWRVKGARALEPAEAAVLQTLVAFRQSEAERTDQPLFRVVSDATLMELVRRAPDRTGDLRSVPGMRPAQVRRHGQGVLRAIREGLHAPAPIPPLDTPEPDDVLDRYDRLRAWRKRRAKARGVESDVILPRTALWSLARHPPQTRGDLAEVVDLGPWRRETYGDEVLALLSGAGPAPVKYNPDSA